MKRSFCDQFRDAVLNAKKSRYRISKETGISESNLSRFCRGESWISAAYANLLAENLGLEIVSTRTRAKAIMPKKRLKLKSKHG